jgi:hypothetical protein
MGTVANIVVGVGATNTVKVGAYGVVEASAVDVGLTDGGVEINVSSEVKEIYVDQHLGAVAAPTIKEGVSVKFNMAEASLANMAMAIGYPTTAVVDSTMSMGGKSDIYDYKTVYINVKGPGPGTAKITIYKAKIKGDSSAKYQKDNVTMVPVEIIGLCDITRTAGDQFYSIVASGLDTTAPTVALSAPVDGGTTPKDAKGTIVWTITEANGVDQSSIVYGNTFSIINTTTAGSAALVAGTIAYTPADKKVTFTPTNNWTASDTFQAVVTTGLKDAAGNALAAMKIEQFSATS